MIRHELQRYSQYKNSGIEWIGETPIQWNLTRNKDIFAERGKFSETGTETLLTVSHITGVTRRSEKSVNMFMAETMRGYKLCKKGDLIINTMWAWMGALGTCNEDGICSPAYCVYKPKKYKPYYHKYFDYLYRIPKAIIEMTKNSKGIVSSRLRLYPRDFFQIVTSLPNYETQKTIADYLDNKTLQIDKKIDLLTKKVDKYSELKQSLINETITHGLDKTVVMKDSGVEWIEKIPKHWEVKRLKDLGTIETSSVDKKTKTSEKLVKLINYKNIYGNLTKEIWNREDYMVVSANVKQLQDKQLKEGDVLFTPSSETIEDIGVSAVVMEDLFNTVYSYHILRLRFNKLIFINFKKYLFNNGFVQFYFSKSVKGTTRKILGLNCFYNLEVPIPPTYEEQKAIADYLDNKTYHIDRIIETVNTEIEKLKELRKTLINDVVTGKIKVTTEGE
ncbi:restriction endonuclease subunit S [Clostridium tyrobutyricum]|uniref:restriction endonuclease subunit S n=1 Tax=Clostridium tyrobutyricum TaxID=1519 RepID=UPI0010AABAFE|nr:restriction endonuclease subunit S [Clostridium tyrobutyricum]QCH27834.1 EcoKI restriction-modification system protein [Clostridium tyrobutyricum]